MLINPVLLLTPWFSVRWSDDDALQVSLCLYLSVFSVMDLGFFFLIFFFFFAYHFFILIDHIPFCFLMFIICRWNGYCHPIGEIRIISWEWGKDFDARIISHQLNYWFIVIVRMWRSRVLTFGSWWWVDFEIKIKTEEWLKMSEGQRFQLSTIGALSLSVVSSVSIVICNKALISTLGFTFGKWWSFSTEIYNIRLLFV